MMLVLGSSNPQEDRMLGKIFFFVKVMNLK